MRIQPCHDFVKIEVIEQEAASRGGILMPDIVKHALPAKKARVLAVGPGRISDNGRVTKPRFEVGDMVYYHDGAGFFELDDDGVKVRILSHTQIIARVADLEDDAKDLAHLRSVRNCIMADLGREPTIEEVTLACDFSEARVKELLSLGG